MSRWQFEWRRDWSEIWRDDFLSHWRELLEQSPYAHAYHVPDLVRQWAETCGRENACRPLIGLAEDDRGRRILLPWVVVTHRGRLVTRRVLEPAGGSLFGYHDPLVGGPTVEEIDWSSLWQSVRREVGRDCDQALLRFVHPRYAAGPGSEPCGEQNPVLPLSGRTDLESLLQQCSANHRGDVRRRLRRLHEQGELCLWIAAPGYEQELRDDFDSQFLAAYEQNGRRRPERNLLRSPGVREFAARVALDGVPAGWAHYAALRLSGRSIAWHLGLFYRNELYWWLPAYDPAFENFSPGKVLLALLIEHGLRNGWSRIHFLTGGHRYKLDWNPEPLDLRAVRWHSPTWRGTLLRTYDGTLRTA